MFVRIIRIDGGESLFECDTACWDRSEHVGGPDAPKVLLLRKDGKVVSETLIDPLETDVYIMNDRGHTIDSHCRREPVSNKRDHVPSRAA